MASRQLGFEFRVSGLGNWHVFRAWGFVLGAECRVLSLSLSLSLSVSGSFGKLKSLRLSPPTQRRTNRESLNPKP